MFQQTLLAITSICFLWDFSGNINVSNQVYPPRVVHSICAALEQNGAKLAAAVMALPSAISQVKPKALPACSQDQRSGRTMGNELPVQKPEIKLPGDPIPSAPDTPQPQLPGDPGPGISGEPQHALPGDPEPFGNIALLSAGQEPAAPQLPGDPAPALPGDPAPELPGDPAPELPGDPAPQLPGDPTAELLGDTNPELPGDPGPMLPGDPGPMLPGDPGPMLPGDPAPGLPGDPAPGSLA